MHWLLSDAMGTEQTLGSLPEVIRLRYAGRCSCGATVARGERAGYVRAERRVVCLACTAACVAGLGETVRSAERAHTAAVAGTPGGGARREHERRVDRRRARLKDRGALIRTIAALVGEPQSTRAWERGAIGEERVGAVLEKVHSRGVLALHDRRIPRSRSNIDHIAIGPAGVYVIDAKRYENAEIRVRRVGGLFSPRRDELLVRGRVKSNLVDGVRRQVEVVQTVLDEAGIEDVPVRGVLCFVDAFFPLFQRRLRVGELIVTCRPALGNVVGASGHLDAAARHDLYCLVGQRLPSMT